MFMGNVYDAPGSDGGVESLFHDRYGYQNGNQNQLKKKKSDAHSIYL